MKFLTTLLLFVLTFAAGATPCIERKDIVGKCFVVHGRLSYKNGGPAVLLWPIGTKRLLGVLGDQLPSNIADHMLEFDDMTYADFEVCPLTEQKPGAMQFVCINTASNPVFRRRNSAN